MKIGDKNNLDIIMKKFTCIVVIIGLTLLLFVFYPLVLRLFGVPVSYSKFFKGMSPAQFLAFSTSSSAATLPVTIECVNDNLGVSEESTDFVLPIGATVNMDGTALYEGIAAIFLAHLYGIELGPVATFSIFFMAMLSSIGAPGMPSASMSGMQMVLLAAGIPLEAIGILIVIDKPLDTFRTAVNVQGDIIGALVTQKYIDKKEQVV